MIYALYGNNYFNNVEQVKRVNNYELINNNTKELEKSLNNLQVDYENKIIMGIRTPEVYNERKRLYKLKNKKIDEILEYRKKVTDYDRNIMRELTNIKYKKMRWFFY